MFIYILKYLKYKIKFNNLPRWGGAKAEDNQEIKITYKQNIQNLISIPIYIRKNVNIDNYNNILSDILPSGKQGLGAQGIIFFDKDLQSIIKINKFNSRDKSIHFEEYNKLPESTRRRRYHWSHLYAGNLTQNEIKQLEDLPNIIYNPEQFTQLIRIITPYVFNQIIKFDIISRHILDLKTFLQIKGFAIYPYLTTWNDTGYIISAVYDYYNLTHITPLSSEHVDKNKLVLYLKNFIDIISDFEKLHKRGYYHGDLQNDCRNIEKTDDDTFIVIDINSISKVTSYENYLQDISSLLKCIKMKTNLDLKINYEEQLKEPSFAININETLDDIYRNIKYQLLIHYYMNY